MFACATYEADDEFIENITCEAEDNAKRIRHHACLGLWCGNNEIEEAWVDWGIDKTERAKHKTDYVKQFELILPAVLKDTDPNTFYWKSSPSSGGGFEEPNSQDKGDVHYWDVWHRNKPFTDYRNYHFRFCSEFGFQSFPSYKSVKEFTIHEDWNIFSPVMENHQKNGTANEKILMYLSRNFRYPKDFQTLLYASQILQAEAIKYGVEHWRRNRGRCMGSIYWQLNDCWPVASWSSIDYYGRWKALHYFAKRFYAPVLLSACEQEEGVELYVTNETMHTVTGKVIWQLRDNCTGILKEGCIDADVSALSVKAIESLDFSSILDNKETKRKTYLVYSLVVNDEIVSEGTVLFVKPKHFYFIDPEISVQIREDKNKYVLSITSKAFAKYVKLDLKSTDCIFSDNYFDLSAGEIKTVTVYKNSMTKLLIADKFEEMLDITSIYDITN